MRARGFFYGRRPEALKRASCLFVLLWAGLSPVADAEERQGGQQSEYPPESEQQETEDAGLEEFLDGEFGSSEDRKEADGGPPLETIPVGSDQLPQLPAAEPSSPRQRGVTDEIVVTATKRELNVRDIAGSVGVVTGEQLEKMNAQSMGDYLKLVPGVILPDLGSDQSVPIIRGIATDIETQPTAPTTGIFLEDMPFTQMRNPGAIPDFNPFDMERVEVLKGPQGTLFGGTALNGAIRYITHKPEHGAWGAKFRQTVSDTRFGGGAWVGFGPVTAGAVNVPLFGEALALRAVGVRRRYGGLYDMRAPDNAGNDLRNEPDADRLKQDHWRVLASWQPPIENFDISAFYFNQDSQRADLSLADNPDEPTSGDDVGRPFASPRENKFTGGNLRMTYDFGWGQLLSTTNHFTQDNWASNHQEAQPPLGAPIDRQNQNEFFTIAADEVKGWTQELRLSSPQGAAGNWQWVAGLAYFRSQQDLWTYIHHGQDIEDPRRKEQVTEEQRKTDFLYGEIDTLGTEKALFGDVTWSPGEHWELSAGGRLFRNDMDGVTLLCGQLILALAPPEPDARPCITEPGTLTATAFNPKVSLRYQLNRSVQFYTLVAKGFQFGGFQLNPEGIGFRESADGSGNEFGPFDSSVLWNFEGGIRTEWLDRRLRFDLTAFRLNWTDLQLFVLVPLGGDAGRIPQPAIPPEIPPAIPPEGSISAFQFGSIENVGRATSTGVELSFAVTPFTGAQWISNAAWIKAVTEVPFDEDHPDGPVPAGSTLPGSPRLQWSNVVSYEHSLPFLPQWNIAAAVTHTRLGKAPDNIRPTGTIFGYDSFDARVRLAQEDSRFQPEFSFGVNNLFDKRGVTAHFAFNRNDDGREVETFHLIRPRTMTLSLSMNF